MRPKPLARLWSNLGVTAKLGLAFALLTLLIVNTALVHSYTLSVVRKAEAEIASSMEIRQLVSEMEGGLEKARRLYRDFILNYPEIGFDLARELYCLPLLAAMDGVIAQSEDLQRRVAASNVSDALRRRDVDINLYLSAARRFSAIFLELVDLVTSLAEPATGLYAQLDTVTGRLVSAVASSDQLTQGLRRMELLAKEYRIYRQRPMMQSVFNAVIELKEMVAHSDRLDPAAKARADELLDRYVAIAGKVLEVDVALRGKVNDFALQSRAVDPISSGLKAAAASEVELATARIDRAGDMAALGIVASSAFGFVCALGVAWLVNASVTRRITAMTAVALELSSGHLDARAAADGGDELGVLGDSFNAMADRMRGLVGHLEENVRARTKELAKTNVELAKKNIELAEKNRALEILSMTDRLTGLHNRRKVEQALQAELLRAKRYRTPYAVVLIDIDRFKQVNDRFGHPAGDAVLKGFADILVAQVRETDLVGRYGGEEFLILCPESDLDVASALAERLRQEIAATDFPATGSLTACFGVAAYRPGDEAYSPVGRADEALYRAKQAGRNRVELEAWDVKFVVETKDA